MLKVLPGQLEEATRLFKHPKLPNNVMLHEFLGLLGKPDAIVIFEAPDAATAADFMVQFGRAENQSAGDSKRIGLRSLIRWESGGHESEPGNNPDREGGGFAAYSRELRC